MNIAGTSSFETMKSQDQIIADYYRKNEQGLLRFAISLLKKYGIKNPTDAAADVVQDVFEKLVKESDEVNLIEKTLHSYVCTKIRWQAVNWARSLNREGAVMVQQCMFEAPDKNEDEQMFEAPDLATPNPEVVCEAREVFDYLSGEGTINEKTLQEAYPTPKLAARDTTAFLLHHISGLTYAEVAEVVNEDFPERQISNPRALPHALKRISSHVKKVMDHMV